MQCIHGGDPFTCKKCTNPYKSKSSEEKGIVEIENKGTDQETIYIYINNARGYSKPEQQSIKFT